LAGVEKDLISRTQLFGNPERAHARISPDGLLLAYLAPLDGVLNIWVAPREEPLAARPVTRDSHRGIHSFSWTYTHRYLLYTQDNDGDEDWHIYRVDVDTADVTDLTPLEKIAARIQGVSPRFPKDILIGLNDRDARFHDLYRMDIETGERTLLQENPGFVGFACDDDYRVRFAITFTAEAGHIYLKPDSRKSWVEFAAIDPTDALTTHPIGFNKSGDGFYLLDSRGRDKSALKVVDLASGREELLAESRLADIDGAILHPTERNVEAVTFTHARQEWKILDSAVQSDFDYLGGVADGELKITSRTLDDRVWTVAYTIDTGPVLFYLYDREKGEARFLFTSQPELESLPLVKMHPVMVPARDGLELVSYLSLPLSSDPERRGRPEEPIPMVLLVHGGPWARDEWGYNPQHQWLADRGYAVLSVNYRGSTGFGKNFINSANREWAARMHDDLIDAVEWAVDQKIALRDKVAIMGGSYGGYATLVALTFTPEVFACGVDIVGPSNLITLMENPPPYWMPLMSMMKVRTGDYTTPEGREFLKSRSPLFFVDSICRPLLIAQGKHDPRVKQAESDQIVAAMEAKGIPVSYMLFTEEGHGFAKPENRQAFFAVAEGFLAQNLGGDHEPIGDAFRGAQFVVPAGADDVPGLSDAIGARDRGPISRTGGLGSQTEHRK
jgi:dipeptidyl aminopeptidase/acylaminoacyl peptidase